MPDVSGPGGALPSAHPNLPATAGLDGFEYRTVAEAGLEYESAEASRIGWGFISLYTLAFISTSLLFLAPLLVTLALKVNSLVGIGQAPNSLAVVTGNRRPVGHGGESVLRQDERPHHLAAGYAAALDGDRPGGRLSGHLMVVLASNIPVVLVGWCIAQLLYNALLAALVAVLPATGSPCSWPRAPSAGSSSCSSRSG
jgi:hypothetical protein